MAYPGNAGLQRRGQFLRTIAIALKQVKRDSLRRLSPDTRHTLQGIDETDQERRIRHAVFGNQKGNFMPGGRLRPDATPENFS